MLGYPWNACKILSGGVPNFPATNFCEMVISSPTFISGSEFSFVLRRYRTKSVSEVCRGKSETSSTSHTVGVPFTIQLDRGRIFMYLPSASRLSEFIFVNRTQSPLRIVSAPQLKWSIVTSSPDAEIALHSGTGKKTDAVLSWVIANVDLPLPAGIEMTPLLMFSPIQTRILYAPGWLAALTCLVPIPVLNQERSCSTVLVQLHCKDWSCR